MAHDDSIPTPIADEFMQTNNDDFYTSVLNEDTIGKVVRSQIHIEAALNAFLEMRMYDFPALEKHVIDFELRIMMALALGLNPSLKGPLKNLGNLRNRFAHKLDATLDKGDMNNLFKSFSAEDKKLISDHYTKIKKLNPLNSEGERRPDSHSAMKPEDRFALYVATLRAALLAALKLAERLEFQFTKWAEADGKEWRGKKAR